MTEEDIARTYEEAFKNAVVHGTGIVRVTFVDGSLQLAALHPDEYMVVHRTCPPCDQLCNQGRDCPARRMPLFDDWGKK